MQKTPSDVCGGGSPQCPAPGSRLLLQRFDGGGQQVLEGEAHAGGQRLGAPLQLLRGLRPLEHGGLRGGVAAAGTVQPGWTAIPSRQGSEMAASV